MIPVNHPELVICPVLHCGESGFQHATVNHIRVNLIQLSRRPHKSWLKGGRGVRLCHFMRKAETKEWPPCNAPKFLAFKSAFSS